MTYNKTASSSAKNSKSQNKIGLFDSGVGGLTVMREVAALLPHEEMVYFGDTARLPYGNKSPEAIVRFARENAQFLLEQNIKLLVIACHTACTHAFSLLKNELPIPVVGVTQSGIQSLLQSTKTKRVAVLGTASTIHSGVLQSQLTTHDPTLTIHAVACPLFVPLVEEGFHSHAAAGLIAEQYLGFLRDHHIDAALLACTHYPLLAPVIQKTLGSTVQLILPARTAALETKSVLEKHSLLNPHHSRPTHQFYASDDPEKFRKSAQLFFSADVGVVRLQKSFFIAENLHSCNDSVR